MSTFQSEYETATNTIDSIVTTQLSSVFDWRNISGNLVKVSASSGFAWGYNSGNTVYICELPCSGNWKEVDLSQQHISNILDIVTDDSNVYILFMNGTETYLLVTSGTNQGTRTVIPLNFPAKHIFSTHTYIWAQDSSNNKQKCSKPCTMSNWQESSETQITITSSDNYTLYGTDQSGQAMQTDETLNSPWKPIGKIQGIINGKGLDGTLYGIDSNEHAFKYKDTSIPLYTKNLDPTSIVVDQTTNQLWMTTATPGEQGNIFTRLQTPEYSSILNSIAPLDKTRSNIVENIETGFKKQTDTMILNKQVQDVVNYFKNIFHIDGTTAKKAMDQSSKLNENIRQTQTKLDEIQSMQPFLFGVIITLLVVILIYMLLSSILGMYIHIIVIVSVLFGIYISNYIDFWHS
jgi:hypothetical protein